MNNQHLCCLMKLQENQVKKLIAHKLQIHPLYATLHPICFVPTLPLYKFCGMYYFFGYYIFGWMVATGNVITENVIIVCKCLKNRK